MKKGPTRKEHKSICMCGDYWHYRREFVTAREAELYDVIKEGGECETARKFMKLAKRYLREAESYRALAYEAHQRNFAPKYSWALSKPKRFGVIDEAALAYYADYSCGEK
jgi:hypothetical protein